MGVTYSRLFGYPIENLVNVFNFGSELVDKVKCNWEDREELAKEFLGFVIGTVVTAPARTQASNGSTLTVVNVTIDPMGVDQDGAENYGKAILTITYRYVNIATELEEYATESIEPASEFVTVGNTNLQWADGVALEPIEAPSIIIRMVEWVYTIHNVSSVPSWIWTLPGRINDAIVTSSDFGSFAKHTLLCGNPSLSRTITERGRSDWNLVARLTYREQTWNKFPRASKDGAEITYEKLYDSSMTQKRVYLEGDFSDIILS